MFLRNVFSQYFIAKHFERNVNILKCGLDTNIELSGFTAQLVEQCTCIAEIPLKAPEVSIRDNRPFSLVHFVFPKRVHAGIFMLACTHFNEQNKGLNLLSMIT